MLLVQSSHFIAFFVNMELVTVAFYVLVAFQRTSIFSLEAGLKYLALGALSSAFCYLASFYSMEFQAILK